MSSESTGPTGVVDPVPGRRIDPLRRAVQVALLVLVSPALLLVLLLGGVLVLGGFVGRLAARLRGATGRPPQRPTSAACVAAAPAAGADL